MAGLRKDLDPSHMAVGVKQLIKLDRKILEDWFRLTGNAGVAYGIIGYATDGLPGGGFLYTNKDSLSVGVVTHIDHCVAEKASPYELLSRLLEHPFISPMVEGGEVLEYAAHMICEGGIEAIPEVYTHGLMVVGDAAGLSSNNGFVVRGMDLAIESGVLAAKTALLAHAKEDYSSNTLRQYKSDLYDSFALKDMKTYSGAVSLMKDKALYTSYPDLMTDIFGSLYEQKSVPKETLRKIALRAMRSNDVSLTSLGRFAWKTVNRL
jgi:electron transfer flavoprotein-quinone oxidoreductase